MKYVNCYLCGSSLSDILFKQEGHDPYLAKVFDPLPYENLNWLACRDCSFVYRSPALTDQELDTLYESYDQDVLSMTTPDDYFDKIISLSNEESENWQKISWLKDVVKSTGRHEISNALDIGCGGGTLLHTARQQLSLKSVNGVELNTVYADLARRRLDSKVINENYVSGLFQEQFDLLINTKVLEHVSDPLPFLKEMHDDLAEGGLLFIEVPDVSDMFSLPPTHERFWIPHIYFFSGNTLGALLKKSGFCIVAQRVIETARNRTYLQIVAEKASAIFEDASIKPYDDLATLKNLISLNMAKHNDD